MRFPFRLSADLFRAKVSSIFSAGAATPPICRVAPDEKALAYANQIPSPVIWLGGTEPLLNPQIGGVANSVVELNRHVFLHTSGHHLRQRIHEFRPNSRLFLTLEFSGREESHARRTGRPDSFRRSLEGIRAAKLCGFLVAAHFTVTTETDPCEIGELIETLDNQDVDGFIASTGGRPFGFHNRALSEKLSDTHRMIRCSRWEDFSRLLEASYAQSVPARGEENVTAAGEGVFEEGD